MSVPTCCFPDTEGRRFHPSAAPALTVLASHAYLSCMAISHGYRSLWSCFAVVALVGNVIASAFCCAPSYSRKTEIVDPILGAIPLCSSVLGTPDSGSKQPRGSKQHCPVCLAAASKALVASTVGLPVTTATLAELSPSRVDVSTIEGFLRLGGLGSRAPPLPA